MLIGVGDNQFIVEDARPGITEVSALPNDVAGFAAIGDHALTHFIFQSVAGFGAGLEEDVVFL